MLRTVVFAALGASVASQQQGSAPVLNYRENAAVGGMMEDILSSIGFLGPVQAQPQPNRVTFRSSAPAVRVQIFSDVQDSQMEDLFSNVFNDESPLFDLVDAAFADMQRLSALSPLDSLGQLIFQNPGKNDHHKDGPCSCHCRADVRKFCLGVDGVHEFASHSRMSSELSKCLASHREELLPMCSDSMDRFDISLKCKLEVEEFCEDVVPGQGRLHKCLFDKLDKLGDTCYGYFEEVDNAVKREKEEVIASAVELPPPVFTTPTEAEESVEEEDEKEVISPVAIYDEVKEQAGKVYDEAKEQADNVYHEAKKNPKRVALWVSVALAGVSLLCLMGVITKRVCCPRAADSSRHYQLMMI